MSEFNVGGTWTLHQGTGHQVTFEIQQNGTSLDGEASTPGMRGKGKGSVAGDRFVYTVDWDPTGKGNGPLGEYSGLFNIEGRITGLTVDLNQPGSQAFWASDRTFARA
ncbi:hypothetical protein [Streptomyces sp. NPDC093094]|uniref:hypothetical protein n=1 Tax=Streptomyces sp. NPDC093094 TaxID=3366026 RepID=UPI0038211C97